MKLLYLNINIWFLCCGQSTFLPTGMNGCIVWLLPACICFVNLLFSFCLPTDVLILWNPTPLFVESWRSNAMYSCFYKVFASGKDINSFALFCFPFICIYYFQWKSFHLRKRYALNLTWMYLCKALLFMIFHILLLAVYFMKVIWFVSWANTIIVAKFYFICVLYVKCVKIV